MSNIAGFSTGTVSDLTIEAVKGWSTGRLNKFLKARLKNIDVHINTITETQQVDGDSFLDLTAIDFERWGIPGEPAKKIKRLIKEIQEEQPGAIELERARLSINFLLDLTDKSPITLIPFVSRPQIEEKLCKILNQNLSNMTPKPMPRTQDYCGIVISGGSGIGKTRIGFEISKIAERNKAIKKLKDRANATFEHIYINMDEIKSLLGPGLDDDVNNKYDRIPEHITKASILLKKLIVIYFLTKVWSSDKIKKCIDLMPNSIKYDQVIKLIYKEKKLDDSITLILVLQIDEFQTGNYWTTTLLRIIKSILVQVNYKTLIIPICTGTTPSKIENLDDSAFNITQYGMKNINLSPMNFEDSMSLFDGFTTHYYGNSDILPEEDERFYRCVVNSIRGIPVIIEIAVTTLAHLGENEKMKKAFQNYDVAKKYWENIKDCVKDKYSKKHWLLSLHNEDNIMKLLYYIHIQKFVTKTDQLNSCTIEGVETSGLIYLEETIEDDKFIPRAPLILITVLVDFFNLHKFFDTILLNPFILINQDNFSDFILRIHHATYGLMIRTGIRSITLREIYGQHIIGPKEVLNHRIHVDTIEYHEQPPLIPKNSSKSKFTKPDLNRKHITVMYSKSIDKRKYREIDVTLDKFIIKLRKRISSANAILPHADEQYKCSEALKSEYRVHNEKTGELSIDTVKKEVEKANATGAERFVIVTPKRFEDDEQNIPEDCAIISGINFVNFIIIYADLVARISAELIDD
ncbi:hypothetical protein C1645_871831 [Glomus cerebriforme]|uniref:SAM domain-containing protein n=1 Tax=Glomus cerebriforme TaxID=658196 RepID=A0A397TK57_9GLOM|nr:hypothetical protein C1645_871831 [Glomus cerebriforme]